MYSQLLMMWNLKLKLSYLFPLLLLFDLVLMIYTFLYAFLSWILSYSFLTTDILWMVFDEHGLLGKSGGGNAREMDFESFLDFVMALKKQTHRRVNLFVSVSWSLGRGYLTMADIHSLFLLIIIIWFPSWSRVLFLVVVINSCVCVSIFFLNLLCNQAKPSLEEKKGNIQKWRCFLIQPSNSKPL